MVRCWSSFCFALTGLGLATIMGASSSGAPLHVTGGTLLAALVLLTTNWYRTTRQPGGSQVWAYRLPFLVVLWIGTAGVLAAWATGAPLVAQDSCGSCKSNLKNLGTALEGYAADHQGAYPVELGALAGKYIPSIPRCRPENPSLFAKALFQATTGVRLTEYDYKRSITPSTYTIWCTTGAHRWAATPRGFPQYSSTEGMVTQ